MEATKEKLNFPACGGKNLWGGGSPRKNNSTGIVPHHLSLLKANEIPLKEKLNCNQCLAQPEGKKIHKNIIFSQPIVFFFFL